MTNTSTFFSARAKRPRRPPAFKNFPAQLASGRIDPFFRRQALLRTCQNEVDLPLMNKIVRATDIVQKLVDLPDGRRAFLVRGEGKYSRLGMIDDVTLGFRDLYVDTPTWQHIGKMYADYKFNPYFDLFLNNLDEALIERLKKFQVSLIDPPPDDAPPHAIEMWPHNLHELCFALNESLQRIKREGRTVKFRERVKTYRRVAHEKRKSLTRLLLRVLNKVQWPRIISLRLFGSRATFSAATAYAQITQYRTKLIDYFKRHLSKDLYRGYALLLKRSAKYGYYLEALIFLRDDMFRPPENFANDIKNQWIECITGGSGQCEARLLMDENHFEAPSHYFDALITATCLTEADFYIQLNHASPNNPEKRSRTYWATRKLASGRKKQKKVRSETAAINRLSARKLVDPLLADARAKAREEEMRLRELPDLPSDTTPEPRRRWEVPLSDPGQAAGTLAQALEDGLQPQTDDDSPPVAKFSERRNQPMEDRPTENKARPAEFEIKRKRVMVKRQQA